MTSRRVSIAFSLLLAAGCMPGLASAAMRCGSQIIDKGTSSVEVTSSCGDPTQIERGSGANSDVQIEFWTYNFGPNLLMERIRIENGMVTDVQDLGYGFN